MAGGEGDNSKGYFIQPGTDSKAGGPDYLLHFTQGKLTSEQL